MSGVMECWLAGSRHWSGCSCVSHQRDERCTWGLCASFFLLLEKENVQSPGNKGDGDFLNGDWAFCSHVGAPERCP